MDSCFELSDTGRMVHVPTPKGLNSKAQGCVLATLGDDEKKYLNPEGVLHHEDVEPLAGVVEPLRGSCLISFSPRVASTQPWALEFNPFGVKTRVEANIRKRYTAFTATSR